MRLIGFDPSLRNWGVAESAYDPSTDQLTVHSLSVIQPALPTGKRVRRNSSDLVLAEQLSNGVNQILLDPPNAVFVEVPHGSQSSRAMVSYGVCIGILGTLRAAGIPFFELSESEVKLSSVGTRKATKTQMITWATTRHPDAPWPMYKRSGVAQISGAKAEHMADAVATIHAGIQSDEFQRLLRISQP